MTSSTIKAPYRARNVADFLIFLASREDQEQKREGITNLKLQKLLYFAQAYYLSKFGKPLFFDQIEAWEYGPVVPLVYRKFRIHKNKPIITRKDTPAISEGDKENLNLVWGIFGGFSASRLVDIVHAHSPWKDANASTNKVITLKAIRDYYSSLLNK